MAATARPTASQALVVVSDVADALEYAASRDVVHRDVKPANVFITATGRCKLGDFGLARISGERAMFLSNDGTVRGTPLYMAPEQLRGEAPTSAWDVYALALMATELLAGRHPFAGMSVRGALEAHLDRGAASAATASALPPPVLAVICTDWRPCRQTGRPHGNWPTASWRPHRQRGSTRRPTTLHSSRPSTCVPRGPTPWTPMACGRTGSGPAGPWSWSTTRRGTGRPNERTMDRHWSEHHGTRSRTPPTTPGPGSRSPKATIDDEWIRNPIPRVGVPSARKGKVRTTAKPSVGHPHCFIRRWLWGCAGLLLVLSTH